MLKQGSRFFKTCSQPENAYSFLCFQMRRKRSFSVSTCTKYFLKSPGMEKCLKPMMLKCFVESATHLRPQVTQRWASLARYCWESKGRQTENKNNMKCLKTFYYQFASDYFLVTHHSHCLSHNFTKQVAMSSWKVSILNCQNQGFNTSSEKSTDLPNSIL